MDRIYIIISSVFLPSVLFTASSESDSWSNCSDFTESSFDESSITNKINFDNDVDSIQHEKHLATVSCATRSNEEGSSSLQDKALSFVSNQIYAEFLSLYLKFKDAQKKYHEQIPSEIRPLVKDRMNKILADEIFKKTIDEHFSYFEQKKEILNRLYSILNSSDFVNPKITKLKFLLRKNETIGRIRIDKIILNDRFPIHHPDFIPLIEHIKEYRTISRKLIDSDARFNKLHHDAQNRKHNLLYTQQISVEHIEAYNQFFDAKNAFNNYRDILKLKACSKQIKKSIEDFYGLSKG